MPRSPVLTTRTVRLAWGLAARRPWITPGVSGVVRADCRRGKMGIRPKGHNREVSKSRRWDDY